MNTVEIFESINQWRMRQENNGFKTVEAAKNGIRQPNLSMSEPHHDIAEDTNFSDLRYTFLPGQPQVGAPWAEKKQ